MASEAQNQPYDNVLKRVVEGQAEVILPLLFPELAGKELEQLTVEMLIPHRTGDRVYKTVLTDPNEQPEIIHIEYEVSPSRKTDKKLLVYHALLWEKHEIPVNTYLILPFKTGAPKPPLIETGRNGRQTLRFEYFTLKLWDLDARRFVAQKAVPAYGLLPCMSETSADMLIAAIEDMLQWYGDRKDLLSDELVCFYTLLERARLLPEAEFVRVEERILMYDDLLDTAPWIEKKIAAGEARGEVKALRNALLAIVREKFPSLEEIAEARVAHMGQPEVLNVLLIQLASATDESAARNLLEAL